VANRSEVIVGGIGGMATGYVLWLVAISIGNDTSTAGHWAPLVLLLSAVLAICAAISGWWLRRRRKHPWAAFAVGLPILPVVLTLAVLANIYV
jgi:cytochrome bd-type quinol oxidase subunit 2